MKYLLNSTKWVVAGVFFFLLTGGPGCNEEEAAIDQPTPLGIEMTYTAEEVSEIRKNTDLDTRAMSIDGVVGIGTTGNSNDDAWIQVMCLNDSVAAHARTILGDSLEGVPIKFAITDTIRAQ